MIEAATSVLAFLGAAVLVALFRVLLERGGLFGFTRADTQPAMREPVCTRTGSGSAGEARSEAFDPEAHVPGLRPLVGGSLALHEGRACSEDRQSLGKRGTPLVRPRREGPMCRRGSGCRWSPSRHGLRLRPSLLSASCLPSRLFGCSYSAPQSEVPEPFCTRKGSGSSDGVAPPTVDPAAAYFASAWR